MVMSMVKKVVVMSIVGKKVVVMSIGGRLW